MHPNRLPIEILIIYEFNYFLFIFAHLAIIDYLFKSVRDNYYFFHVLLIIQVLNDEDEINFVFLLLVSK